MRKRVFGRHFSRTKNQRKALFRGLVGALVEKGEIVTTLPKAKAIKPQAEKLVTKAKRGTLTDQRLILRFLGKRALVNRLVMGIAPLFKDRKGGYLRIVHLGRRGGDAAEMAKLMFTEDLTKMAGKPVAAEKVKEVPAPKEPKVTKEVKKETERKVLPKKREERE
ncbi:MAG TPA: 50S ribosomal protein L17 [Patescibacteria group bacterium]|nr:50S ribosomal protein L17 [Patescibacteria group bacterium]